MKAAIVYLVANALIALAVPSMERPVAGFWMLALIFVCPAIAGILAIVVNPGSKRAPASVVASFCFLAIVIALVNLMHFAFLFRGV